MDFEKSPYVAPRLTLRVGVTGHRPNKLCDADMARLGRSAKAVLNCLAEEARRLQTENDAAASAANFEQGVTPVLRLATAIAAGADSLCAEAAISVGYELNIILPFPKRPYIESQNFNAQELETFEQLWAHMPGKTTRTELDVTGAPDDSIGYVAAGHLILAHSDVLFAVWNGESGDGAGGTADILSEAQRRGLLVVWLALDGALRIWVGHNERLGPAEQEWQPLEIDADGDSCSPDLSDRLRRILCLPPSRTTDCKASGHALVTAQHYLNRFRNERTRRSSTAIGYNFLQWVFLGSPRPHAFVDYSISLANAEPQWQAFTETARRIGGRPSANRLRCSLQARWEAADNLAIHYSHMFRTSFVLNFFLAATAVFLGLLVLPVGVWLDGGSLLHAKSALVAAELLCIGYILWNTRRGNKFGWHQRWLDYRSLAEALRPARLAVLIGSSPLRPASLEGATASETWVAWYVRCALREIPPPTAVIGSQQLREVIETAVAFEIGEQITYHKKTADKLQILDDRMEVVARALLLLTVLVGVVYILVWGHYLATNDKVLAKDIVKPWATFFAGALPVFGAAVFGIRATGDFRSAVNQSRRMVAELLRLQERLKAQYAGPDQSTMRQIFAQATRAMSDDVRIWSMIYREHGLEAGF